MIENENAGYFLMEAKISDSLYKEFTMSQNYLILLVTKLIVT